MLLSSLPIFSLVNSSIIKSPELFNEYFIQNMAREARGPPTTSASVPSPTPPLYFIIIIKKILS